VLWVLVVLEVEVGVLGVVLVDMRLRRRGPGRINRIGIEGAVDRRGEVRGVHTVDRRRQMAMVCAFSFFFL